MNTYHQTSSILYAGEESNPACLEDEINRIYGCTGMMVHNAILDLLNNRDTVYLSSGSKLIYHRHSVECVFGNLDLELVEKLKSTLAWICFLLRCPVENELFSSNGP